MWWFPQLQMMTCHGVRPLLQEEGLVHERQGFQLVQLNITTNNTGPISSCCDAKSTNHAAYVRHET